MRKITTALASLALVLPLTGMAGGNKSAEQKADKQAKTMKVSELKDNIDKHSGKKVTLKGQVEDKSVGNFVLDGEGFWNDEIVVIPKKDLKATFEDGAEVTVTGTVVTMSLLEIEREYGWDFDPQVEIELEDQKNYVVADSIEVTKSE